MTKEEKDKEARWFLIQNSCIIRNLHKEDAINSCIKDAFIAGIELGEKTYKEKVLGKAKRELDSKGISGEEVKLIFRIFPELCKSEDDKIREEIVEFLDSIWHLGKNANLGKWDKCDCSKWICWLEKQKKQNSVLESTHDSDGYNSSISSEPLA